MQEEENGRLLASESLREAIWNKRAPWAPRDHEHRFYCFRGLLMSQLVMLVTVCCLNTGGPLTHVCRSGPPEAHSHPADRGRQQTSADRVYVTISKLPLDSEGPWETGSRFSWQVLLNRKNKPSRRNDDLPFRNFFFFLQRYEGVFSPLPPTPPPTTVVACLRK